MALHVGVLPLTGPQTGGLAAGLAAASLAMAVVARRLSMTVILASE